MNEGEAVAGQPRFRCEGQWVADGKAVVTIHGELDLATTQVCHGVLDDLDEEKGPYRLVVDLSGCTFIDSTGIGFLVRAHHRTEHPLRVVTAHAQVRKVLSLTALDAHFDVHDTKAQALDALGETGTEPPG